ncbi:GNAT family N-acetyltransferase [bacterium]|nr:GNAT family N-acetyltransferase [bacterium]
MHASTVPAIEVEAVRSLERFREIGAEWTRALDDYPSRTLFITHAWLESWWTAFADDTNALCLVAREGSRIVGMAPLAIERRRIGPCRAPVLRFLGNELSPRSDLVVLDREADVLDAFMTSLGEADWVYFDCGRVPSDSPGLSALVSRAEGGVSSIRPRRDYRIPCVPLDGSWEEYLETRSRNFRRARRRDEERGRGLVERQFPGDIADPERALAAIRSVSIGTWAHERSSSLASDDRTWSLYERLLRAMAPSGRAGASFLLDGDDAVAFLVWMKDGGTVYYLKHGYRASHADRMAGALLMAATLERGFREHPGCVVDLDCAVSDTDYKLRWASAERRAAACYVFHSRWSSRLIGNLFTLKRGLRIPFRVTGR